MRILYLTHYFPPEGNAPASRAYELSRRWVSAGCDVQVVTCAPNVPDGVVYEGYRNRPVSCQRIDGIDVTRVWTYLAANQGKVRRIANYLSYMASATLAGLLLRRPDVMVASSPQFFAGWAGAWIHRLRRVPFVLEIRDLWPETISAVGAITSARILSRLERMERSLYRSSDRIVTVGAGYRERLVQRGVPAGKIDVVPNGIDPAMFEPRGDGGPIRRRYGLDGKFVCAYVGTIGLCAGLEVVLSAAQRLAQAGRDDVAFLLVGDGAERQGLESRAEAMGLDNVIFTGRQPKQTMPAFLSAADTCLVHLKRRDVFRSVYPSKIFEAAAMSRPILLGVQGAAEALVRRMGAGVCFQPEDPDALVRGLGHLAGDPALRRRLGHRGRQHVLEHFNHDRLAGRYLEILEAQALGSPGRCDRAGAGPQAPATDPKDRGVRRCA